MTEAAYLPFEYIKYYTEPEVIEKLQRELYGQNTNATFNSIIGSPGFGSFSYRIVIRIHGLISFK
jgi:hypothetical protein